MHFVHFSFVLIVHVLHSLLELLALLLQGIHIHTVQLELDLAVFSFLEREQFFQSLLVSLEFFDSLLRLSLVQDLLLLLVL